MKQKRKLSREARERMALGAVNLAAWRERTDKKAADLEAEVTNFRTRLLEDCGPNPSATRLALVESCTTTFAAIVRMRSAVIRGPKAQVGKLVERVSWTTGNLSRMLKLLNLDAKPKPRTLADIFPAKVAPNGQIEPQKERIRPESPAKPSDLTDSEAQ